MSEDINTIPLIQLKNLEKVYQGKDGPVYALKNINLSINKGDIYGIIGRSGAGKSTLIRCVNLLERPTSGAVIFEGNNLCELPQKKLRAARRSMGMIFQQFNLLEQRSALENICFPLELENTPRKTARKRAEELLELVGLSGRKDNYPSQLSGGQKQRVAIARALATNPEVLLCDEATSALDPTTTESILALIKNINENFGITAIIITHEMSVIDKICTQVAIINKGEIAEKGAVQEIFFHPETEIAASLVLPEALQHLRIPNLYRLIFNGRESAEPVISNLVLTCGCPVNIMFADTRDLDGHAVGQMVLELPSSEEARKKIFDYIRTNNLILEKMSHAG